MVAYFKHQAISYAVDINKFIMQIQANASHVRELSISKAHSAA